MPIRTGDRAPEFDLEETNDSRVRLSDFAGRRNVEGGPRQDHLQHAAYRVLFGARGDLGYGWNYDISGQYGETILSEEYTNDMSISRIQHALQVVRDPATGAPVSSSSGC